MVLYDSLKNLGNFGQKVNGKTNLADQPENYRKYRKHLEK